MNEQEHPIIRELLSQPFKSRMEKRAIYAVVRSISSTQRLRSEKYQRFYPHDKAYEWEKIFDLDYGQFLQELQKDNGGLVGTIPGVGKLAIEALRKRLLFTSVEYGYA